MPRWDPHARERLQEAAIGLFLERGYHAVTIADITDRAGLTKRSFFNHFPDKREILFADAEAFEATIADHLAQPEPAVAPLDTALHALTRAGESLAGYAPFAASRRDLIASSTELQERNLIKLATVTRTLTNGLIARGTPPRSAALAAHAAMTIFNTAYDDWIDHPGSAFARHVNRARDDLAAVMLAPNMHR